MIIDWTDGYVQTYYGTDFVWTGTVNPVPAISESRRTFTMDDSRRTFSMDDDRRIFSMDDSRRTFKI